MYIYVCVCVDMHIYTFIYICVLNPNGKDQELLIMMYCIVLIFLTGYIYLLYGGDMYFSMFDSIMYAFVDCFRLS